jgi:hypothetical protein
MSFVFTCRYIFGFKGKAALCPSLRAANGCEGTSILEIWRNVAFCFRQSDGPEWDVSHHMCQKQLNVTEAREYVLSFERLMEFA